jgi:hypothetical protein
VRVLVAVAGGFLLAVLWFDLMFDVQVRRLRGATPADAERTLASIAAYYRRVVVDAWPMNRLVATMMLVMIVGSSVRLIAGTAPRWQAALALVLALVPTGLALARVLANAARLGTRSEPPATQAELARTIYRDHLLCLACIVGFLVVQLSM